MFLDMAMTKERGRQNGPVAIPIQDTCQNENEERTVAKD